MKKLNISLIIALFLLNLSAFNLNLQFIYSNNDITIINIDNVRAKSPFFASIDATVHINASDIIRELQTNLYGTSINFIDNGSGILDPATLEIYDGVIDLFKTMNLSTIRFPGGSLSEKYQWWYGIGPKALRPIGINAYSGGSTTNNYGMDEHYDFCKAIGAIPTISVNFGNGTPLEAANWVEYCNSIIPGSGTGEWTVNDFEGNDTAPTGYFAWLRGQYGHNQPYNITNWEVGNEVYSDWTNYYNATQYATRFNNYYSTMKAVDPTIKIAAVGYEVPDGIWGTDNAPWNQEVARIAGANMDALHIHTYGPVTEDGKTVFFWGNGEITQTVNIPQAGDYEMWITAEGMNGVSGAYPSSPNNYANLSINVDGVSQINFSVVIANPRLYNNTINFPTAGNHQLGIEFYNDDPGRDIMMWSEVTLENETSEILIEYKNQTLVYNAVMATANYRGESVYNISKILEAETGRDDIEIWVTEFNTLYNTIGFGIDQPLKFQSAVAMTDMAHQFVKNGADGVQQWSSLNDFYFSLMRDARSLGDTSMFHTFSLLLDGWGQYLLNSTVTCPTFNLESQVGWIPPRKDNSYLDVLPTLNNNELSLILINKHPTEELNVDIDVEGFNSTQTALLTIVNSSTIGAMDLNLPSENYNYTQGKIGQALKINNSRIIEYPSYENAFARKGTIEFWIKPEWDGDDNKNYPIMSICQTFQLIKHEANAIVAVLTNDNWTDNRIIFGSTAAWNAGEWHHIALTWDVTKNMTLYLDNVKQMTVALNDYNIYFENRQPMIIGSSLYNRNSNINASFDEFRISKIARSDAQISLDYSSVTPLIVDDNTTVMFHFDNSIEDSETDQQTIITTIEISYHTSGGIISIPRCSIALLQLQKYKAPSSHLPDDDDDDDTSDENGNPAIPGYNIRIIYGVSIIVPIFIAKKLKKPTEKR